jgi:hypothetical protein
VILNNTDYPGKNDTHIGMTYPEIVTTVKEDALYEMTLTKKSKLIQESNELDKMFSRDDAYSNIEPKDWDTIKQYLEFLRQSGIVNMFQAASFLYAPLEWIMDQAKWKDMDEYSEAAFDSLIDLQPQVQSIMVNAAIKSIGNDEFDVSTINRKLIKIANHVIIDLFENW